jgi:L-alanine-DL-glutamate epimerase-like enolase superfamily enzyme
MLAAPTGHIAGFNAWAQPLFKHPVVIEDGDIVLSERPGLGLELDEEALIRFAIT